MEEMNSSFADKILLTLVAAALPILVSACTSEPAAPPPQPSAKTNIDLPEDPQEKRLRMLDQKIDGGDATVDDYVNRAVIFRDQRKWEACIADANRVIDLDKNNGDAYALRAGSFYNLGMPEEALKDFQMALKLKPDQVEALNAMGWSYLYMHQPQNALLTFDKAIKAGRTIPESYAGKCDAYRVLKKYDLALQSANKSIELSPTSVMGYQMRYTLYKDMGQGKSDKALKDLASIAKYRRQP